MPKQLRYAIKQKLQGSHNEVTKSALKLCEMQELYRNDGHPEIADTLQPWIAVHADIIKFLDAFIAEV